MSLYSGHNKQVLANHLQLALEHLCQQGDSSHLEMELHQLEQLGLVRQHLMGWSPTWLGHAVNNWHRQLELAMNLDPEAPIPEPTEAENGEQRVPGCDRYRETYFRPGSCWCLKRRWEHADQAVEIAEEWLSHHNQTRRAECLQLPPLTPRPLSQLRAQIGPLEAAVLQALTSPKGLGELSLQLLPLCHYFQLKTAVDRLLELELLLIADNLLQTTWEGRRLASWMGQ
ncbi:hypothetical protein JST97_06370 [bacterium]|nr:hypothetical protein [bacterium]